MGIACAQPILRGLFDWSGGGQDDRGPFGELRWVSLRDGQEARVPWSAWMRESGLNPSYWFGPPLAPAVERQYLIHSKY